MDQVDRSPIMSRFGFKELLADNWLEADYIMGGFVKVDSTGKSISMTGRDWVTAILKPQLDEQTPEDVQALFEVARGAMAYGYFFYPLYTLAAEQLFRVADAAVQHKCRALNAPSPVGSFSRRIHWLADNGVIDADETRRWHTMRELRNAASHRDRQEIVTPGNAIGLLERVAQSIGDLFGSG